MKERTYLERKAAWIATSHCRMLESRSGNKIFYDMICDIAYRTSDDCINPLSHDLVQEAAVAILEAENGNEYIAEAEAAYIAAVKAAARLAEAEAAEADEMTIGKLKAAAAAADTEAANITIVTDSTFRVNYVAACNAIDRLLAHTMPQLRKRTAWKTALSVEALAEKEAAAEAAIEEAYDEWYTSSILSGVYRADIENVKTAAEKRKAERKAAAEEAAAEEAAADLDNANAELYGIAAAAAFTEEVKAALPADLLPIYSAVYERGIPQRKAAEMLAIPRSTLGRKAKAIVKIVENMEAVKSRSRSYCYIGKLLERIAADTEAAAETLKAAGMKTEAEAAEAAAKAAREAAEAEAEKPIEQRIAEAKAAAEAAEAAAVKATANRDSKRYSCIDMTEEKRRAAEAAYHAYIAAEKAAESRRRAETMTADIMMMCDRILRKRKERKAAKAAEVKA